MISCNNFKQSVPDSYPIQKNYRTIDKRKRTKKKMKVYWHTSQRTKGIFLEASRKRLAIYEHSIVKKKFSKNNAIRFIQLLIFLKKKKIKYIVFDGFSTEILFLAISLKLLNIIIILRMKGGMNNEYLDGILFKKFFLLNFVMNTYFSLIRNGIIMVSDTILTVSSFLKSQILYELSFVDSKKIRVLLKPTVPEANLPVSLSFKRMNKIDKNINIITTLTGFRYFRKYDAIIYYHQSMLEVLRNNLNWHWIIAGTGDGLDYVKKKVLTSAHKLGIENQVQFIGFVHNTSALYSDTDIFFYPTFRDTASQALKESQLHALPAIINRSSCGPVEFIPPEAKAQEQIIEEEDELKKKCRSL
ncbi:MAG: glycosyltransferase [Candidatus Electrothrix sp. EH2]|nr:glycosyltransferase [Candidatus Electrothrix sp. EH2]